MIVTKATNALTGFSQPAATLDAVLQPDTRVAMQKDHARPSASYREPVASKKDLAEYKAMAAYASQALAVAERGHFVVAQGACDVPGARLGKAFLFSTVGNAGEQKFALVVQYGKGKTKVYQGFENQTREQAADTLVRQARRDFAPPKTR